MRSLRCFFFISYRKLFPKKLNSNSDVFVISPSQNVSILPSFLHIQIGFASIRVKEGGLIYFASVIFSPVRGVTLGMDRSVKSTTLVQTEFLHKLLDGVLYIYSWSSEDEA